jgi:hypothetical protein
MAIPLLAYAGFYASIGALDALVESTVVGLPQRIAWFVPFPRPSWRAVWFFGVIVASFAVLHGWRAWEEPRRRWRLAAALVALAGCAGVLLVEAARAPGLHAYLVRGRWTREVFSVVFWVPFLVLAGATLERRAPEPPAGGASALGRRDLVALLGVFAAANLMQFYPAADLPHAVMSLPAFLPLLAGMLTRLTLVAPGAAALGAFWLLGAAWPFVQPRLVTPPAPPGGAATFARASGITPGDPKSVAAANLVRHLATATTREDRLLVLTAEQMLYFLAGVRSALPHDEFVLYLVGIGLIADGDARALVDEDAMIARLARAQPLVVEHEGSAAVARFRRAFPRVAGFIDRRYRLSEVIDGYRVLVPEDGPPRSPPASTPQ